MILRFLFGLVLNGFSIGILEFIILDKLTPNYIIISYEIGKIPSSIIFSESGERWRISIILMFQIIGLLFYLEIFEFNFCSLDKNTKRNINERMISDGDFENRESENEVSIGGYDITEGLKNSEEISEEK